MAVEQKPVPSDEDIRTRAYHLWENEGRQGGKDQEYWLRAKTELEAELEANWHAASMEGETTAFVLPVLPIATPPVKTVAVRLSEDEPQLRTATG